MKLFDFDEKMEAKVSSFDCSYSWSDMANALTDAGIPYGVVKNLADVKMSILFKRPLLDLVKFDDYLHDRFGNYESEGKSMSDVFGELFGDKASGIAYYFGVGEVEG